PPSASQNKYIVIATDYASKWTEARALRNKSANAVAHFLIEDIFARHGPPKNIRSDQGTEFVNSIFKKTTEIWNARHKLSSPYHPQTNGLVERTNRTIMEKLEKLVYNCPTLWDIGLPYALFAYRISPIGHSGYTPFELLYGRAPTLTFNFNDIPDSFNWATDDISEYFKQRLLLAKESTNIQFNLQDQHIKRVERENNKRSETQSFTIGTQVLIKNRKQNKLQPAWIGPFTIASVGQKGSYTLKTPTEKLININQIDLKEYIPISSKRECYPASFIPQDISIHLK
ncbi:hypothetical protein ENBRE01_3467, partial [Enteropsectra breve]